MTLELKVKRIMLTAAIDIIIKGINKSPERCARSLTELGQKSFPDVLTKPQLKALYTQFSELCKNREITKVKELFFLSFTGVS